VDLKGLQAVVVLIEPPNRIKVVDQVLREDYSMVLFLGFPLKDFERDFLFLDRFFCSDLMATIS